MKVFKVPHSYIDNPPNFICWHSENCWLGYEELPSRWARFWQYVLFGWRWSDNRESKAIGRSRPIPVVLEKVEDHNASF